MPEIADLFKCNICGIRKDRSLFNVNKSARRGGPDCHCIKCDKFIKGNSKKIKKKCCKCKEEKTLDCFLADKTRKYHKGSTCRDCNKLKCIERKEKNPQKYRDLHRRWRIKNRGKIKEYREKNKDKLNAKRKEHRENNKDKIKLYLESRKDHIREKSRIRSERKRNEKKSRQIAQSISMAIYANLYKIECLLCALFYLGICKEYEETEAEIKREERLRKSRLYYKERSKDPRYMEKVRIKQKEYYYSNVAMQVAKSKRKKAEKIQRSPSWANNDVINDFYELREFISELSGDQWHVDHEVPLNGDTVSGLHVAANLRIITAKDNLEKSNKFDSYMFDHKIVNENEVGVRVIK